MSAGHDVQDPITITVLSGSFNTLTIISTACHRGRKNKESVQKVLITYTREAVFLKDLEKKI